MPSSIPSLYVIETGRVCFRRIRVLERYVFVRDVRVSQTYVFVFDVRVC